MKNNQFKNKSIYFVIFSFLQLLNISLLAQSTNYRDSIDVLNYILSINQIDYAKKALNTTAKIILKPQFDKIETIKLDLLELQVDSVYFNAENHSFLYKNNILTVKLATQLAETCTLTVFYHGKPEADQTWGGFHFAQNYVFNYGVGMAANPPNFGRAWFPCIDNFTDRASYEFFITTKNNEMAVANGLLQSKTTHGNSTVFHWKTQFEIPTYLAAIAVGDFVELSENYVGSKRTIPISIFVPPFKKNDAPETFRNLKAYLALFEQLFGEYVWEKVGYVSVPFSGGAMEHAGLISLSNSSIDGTLDSETLIAHELVHHWFGNLVTCQTEKDMWLNEGWASYCEALVIRELKGENAYKEYVLQNHSNVLNFTHKRDGAYLPIYGISHENTYGSTVYDKGADAVYALNQYLGDSLFFAITKQYLADFAFKTVNTKQFEQFYSQKSNLNLSDFFQNWFYTKGFSHFSVASFSAAKKKHGFSSKVKIVQNLKERNYFSNSNKIELLFIGKEYSEIRTVLFSGKEQEFIFSFDFQPISVILDPNSKLSDAAIRETKKLENSTIYNFEYSDCEVFVDSFERSFDLQISKNYLKADNLNKRIFNEYYWTLSGAFFGKSRILLKISDAYQFQNVSKNELYLYHRKNASESWHKIEANFEITYSGLKVSCNLVSGDYCVGFE